MNDDYAALSRDPRLPEYLRAFPLPPREVLIAAAMALERAEEVIRFAEAALPPLDEGETKSLPKRIADEMADLYMVQRHASRVFCHVTNGAISKVHTLPEVVCAVADDCVTAAANEAAKELETERDEALARVAELESPDGPVGPFLDRIRTLDARVAELERRPDLASYLEMERKMVAAECRVAVLEQAIEDICREITVIEATCDHVNYDHATAKALVDLYLKAKSRLEGKA